MVTQEEMYQKFHAAFLKALSEHRASGGTGESFGKLANRKKQYVSSIERGHRKSLKVSTMQELAKAWDLDIDISITPAEMSNMKEKLDLKDEKIKLKEYEIELIQRDLDQERHKNALLKRELELLRKETQSNPSSASGGSPKK